MKENLYFSYTDKFLQRINEKESMMMSITDYDISVIPDVVNKLMSNEKYNLFFTHSSFVDSFNYSDIIIWTPSMYLYFSKVSMDTMYKLRIIHKNNREEIKLFLAGLKKINKL